GVKGFLLSMIETAIELSDGRISGAELRDLMDLGRSLLTAPTELIDGVDDTVAALAEDHRLVLITKGDLLHQETKLAASGLGERFWRIAVVAEKDVPTYRRILDLREIPIDDFVMV